MLIISLALVFYQTLYLLHDPQHGLLVEAATDDLDGQGKSNGALGRLLHPSVKLGEGDGKACI